jgi:hypothetical protein
MARILLAGCSFSESMIHSPSPKWKPWTDMVYEDYNNKYEIINVAQSSFGQGLIAQRTLEMLAEQHIKFDVDFAIIQWSSIGRGYAVNEDEFVKRIFKQNEMAFAPYVHEYLTNGSVTEHSTTIASSIISDNFYKSSLTHMVYVKKLLQCYNIPHKMFWGWEQLNEKIANDNHNLLQLLYDDDFIRIGTDDGTQFGPHGGMSEYIVEKIGAQAGLISPSDSHPSTAGHTVFYQDIIKPIIENLGN